MIIGSMALRVLVFFRCPTDNKNLMYNTPLLRVVFVCLRNGALMTQHTKVRVKTPLSLNRGVSAELGAI